MRAEKNEIATLKQYAYVREYINIHGYAPAFSEIQEYMGHKSISSTQYHMKKLFKAGFLETDIEGDLLPRAYRLGKNPLERNK